MSKQKKIKSEEQIVLDEDLTAINAGWLKELLQNHIAAGIKKIVVDLKKISMIDSIGLSTLIAAQNSIKKENGEIALINVGNGIGKLLKITRLDTHLNVSYKN